MYILFLRPQRRRRMDQQDMLAGIAEGDEIVTAGGMYGFVREVHDDNVTLEVAPGVEVRIARRAVAGIVEKAEVDEDEDEDSEDEDPEVEEGDAEEVAAIEPPAPSDGSQEPEASEGRS
jgi:preprotein translocase subunit YajC